MAESASDPEQLLTALTTEHFGLQGSRSTTTSEAGSRSSLYVSAVSSTLIALGFIGQVSEVGDTFKVFALVALPTVFLLGLFTFVRLVELSVEDLMYGRAINRIRHKYLEIAGPEARLFLLVGNDDFAGVARNMSVTPGFLQAFVAAGTMVAVINGVVGGAALALALDGWFSPPLGVCVGAGAILALTNVALSVRWSGRRFEQAERAHAAIFPSAGTLVETP